MQYNNKRNRWQDNEQVDIILAVKPNSTVISEIFRKLSGNDFLDFIHCSKTFQWFRIVLKKVLRATRREMRSGMRKPDLKLALSEVCMRTHKEVKNIKSLTDRELLDYVMVSAFHIRYERKKQIFSLI